MYWLLNTKHNTPYCCSSIVAVAKHIGISENILYDIFSRKKNLSHTINDWHITKSKSINSMIIDTGSTKVDDVIAFFGGHKIIDDGKEKWLAPESIVKDVQKNLIKEMGGPPKGELDDTIYVTENKPVMIEKRLINLELVEFAELIHDDDKYNLRLKMVSGSVVNSIYDNQEKAQADYNKIKSGFINNMESNLPVK
jgi:hypothetical protein